MQTECNAVFLFISELNSSYTPGTGTMQDKISCGQYDYAHNIYPELDLTTEEGRANHHEVMWLERLYKELDEYFDIKVPSTEERLLALESERYREDSYKWTVPIEVDATSLT